MLAVKTLFNTAHALRLVRKHRIQHVISGHLLSVCLAALACKKLHAVSLTLIVYGAEFKVWGKYRVIRKFLKQALDRAEKIIVINDAVMGEYMDFQVPEERVVKITPGVDPRRFYPGDKPARLIKEFGLEGKKVLLTVARLDERKGHDKVIEALPAILKVMPEIRYLIAGTGEEEPRLRSMVRELGLEEQVLFAGSLADDALPLYYNLCDIFILPNRETERYALWKGEIEGFGIVFLEAAACGKPVIAGRSGAVDEVVIDGDTGLLVDPRSAPDIAGAVLRLCRAGGERTRMGARARARAEEKFLWQDRAEQFRNLIHDLEK